MQTTSTTHQELGYKTTDKGVECIHCHQTYVKHDGRAVEGTILRSHRRNCTVAPEYVATPGVCWA